MNLYDCIGYEQSYCCHWRRCWWRLINLHRRTTNRRMKICRRLRIASFLFPECLSNRAGRPLYSIDLLANVPIVFVAHRLIAEPSPSQHCKISQLIFYVHRGTYLKQNSTSEYYVFMRNLKGSVKYPCLCHILIFSITL